MSKKTRMIALALVLGVTVVGAGYAAWGSRITDNTTLRSGVWSVVLENDDPGHGSDTGSFGSYDGYAEFDANEVEGTVHLEKDKIDMENPLDISGATRVQGNNYVYTVKAKIESDKKTATFKFYNMHPGARACTQFEMRNFGSIPAKVGNVTVKLNNGAVLTGELAELANAIKVDGAFYYHTDGLPSTQFATITGVSLSNLEQALEEALRNKELAPQHAIFVGWIRDGGELEFKPLTFYIPADALDGNTGMNAELDVSIEFDFVQYNQMTPGA